MRRFKWIPWNLQKIDAHGLSVTEVEAAFDDVIASTERRDGSYQTLARTSSGRIIWIIWRFDREADGTPNIVGEIPEPPIFVVTAY